MTKKIESERTLEFKLELGTNISLVIRIWLNTHDGNALYKPNNVKYLIENINTLKLYVNNFQDLPELKSSLDILINGNGTSDTGVKCSNLLQQLSLYILQDNIATEQVSIDLTYSGGIIGIVNTKIG